MLTQVVRLDFEKSFAKNTAAVEAREAVELSCEISSTLLDKTVDELSSVFSSPAQCERLI